MHRTVAPATVAGPTIVPLAGSRAGTGELRPSAPTTTPRRMAVRPLPQPVPPGEELVLADGSLLRLARGGEAWVSAPDRGRTVVRLTEGSVGLFVTHRRPEDYFEVQAGGYTFRTLGTSFRVSVESGPPELLVSEGEVAVLADGRELERVAAGGRWAAAPVPEAAGAGAPGTVNPAADPGAPAPATYFDCRALAHAEGPRRAVPCLEGLARASGLEAELAMHELARLRRDEFGDPAGALRALREHRARFPASSLGEEVRMEIVELLARSGEADAALAESASLLEAATPPKRRADLLVLRGNLLRAIKRDCPAADREYAAAELSSSPGPADDAAYWRAVCREMQGDRAGAAAALTRYLQRPHPAHAAEAQRRLQALQP
jgi:hypothetical protein